MSKQEPFSEIETVEYEGQTFACVYDLVVWLKDMALDDSFQESHREGFVYTAQQLTRLVTK